MDSFVVLEHVLVLSGIEANERLSLLREAWLPAAKMNSAEIGRGRPEHIAAVFRFGLFGAGRDQAARRPAVRSGLARPVRCARNDAPVPVLPPGRAAVDVPHDPFPVGAHRRGPLE